MAREVEHGRSNVPPSSRARAAGSVATVAMSAVMVAGDRAGLMGEQPPKAVARSALREAGVDSLLGGLRPCWLPPPILDSARERA